MTFYILLEVRAVWCGVLCVRVLCVYGVVWCCVVLWCVCVCVCGCVYACEAADVILCVCVGVCGIVRMKIKKNIRESVWWRV